MKFRPTLRGIVFSALFAALLSVLSLFNISLGFSPVPISLENFVVMLVGAMLGPVYGFFSMFLVVLLTALGLPLLQGSGGMAVLLGPSGGFVWMYPIAALLIGLLVGRLKRSGVTAFILYFLAFEVCGSLLLYVTGVPWLAHVAHFTFTKAMLLGCYPYLPGDAIKAIASAAIILPVRRFYPVSRLIGPSTSRVVRIDQ
ncbi:MAG: biotin transporter BioY [Firmicutes bacterium]|nr:biotin transporter BioY [Bacillota bacterium]